MRQAFLLDLQIYLQLLFADAKNYISTMSYRTVWPDFTFVIVKSKVHGQN